MALVGDDAGWRVSSLGLVGGLVGAHLTHLAMPRPRTSSMCDKGAEFTATQDSLAAALVTQIALRLDRLDPAQCLRGIDDGDAGMTAERQQVLAIA